MYILTRIGIPKLVILYVINLQESMCEGYMCYVSHFSHVQLFVAPRTIARLLCPWNSPGKNTGVGRHSFLQGLFPIQRSNQGLLYCWWIFLES